jgi:AcrR family transcriptional regulator
MDQLRESFILATIKEGAENPSNKGFSTKDIAKDCGVSEFSLFSLFKTKDALVKETLDYVIAHFIADSKKAAMASRDLNEYVRHMLFASFQRPAEMEFLANYGFWTGKSETDPIQIQTDFVNSIADSKEAFVFLGKYDDETLFLIWSYLTRHINYFVENVYDGIVPDSREYRDRCAALLSSGVAPFLKMEVK